jgi:hypothetical protein
VPPAPLKLVLTLQSADEERGAPGAVHLKREAEEPLDEHRRGGVIGAL